MTVHMFLLMLFIFSVTSDFITQGIKTLIKDKVNFSSNIIVLIVSFIVGGIGMLIYYVLTDTVVGNKEVIYIFLMSLATWIVGMNSYDKVRQTFAQIRDKKMELGV